VVTLALRVLGYSNTALYDGSWSEYGSVAYAPLETV
jgi:3-mercaptopyruvate sulfurtransferase SseA